MTPAEAAKILEAIEDSLCQSAEYNDDWSDAFDLAIAALEENARLRATLQRLTSEGYYSSMRAALAAALKAASRERNAS